MSVDNLKTFQTRLEAKADAKAVWIVWAFSIIGLIVAVIGLVR